MDVFYHWRDITEDLKAGRIGYFRSNSERLKELQEGTPDDIWVFRTPRGLKGQVQLHARLRWADTARMPMQRRPGESYMFYDPASAGSVVYPDSATPQAIEAATSWVRQHLPSAIGSNFLGLHGQHALRGAALAELRRMAGPLATAPFTDPADSPA